MSTETLQQSIGYHHSGGTFIIRNIMQIQYFGSLVTKVDFQYFFFVNAPNWRHPKSLKKIDFVADLQTKCQL